MSEGDLRRYTLQTNSSVTGAPTFIRHLTLPAIPEVTAYQEYDNPAFDSGDSLFHHQGINGKIHQTKSAPELTSSRSDRVLSLTEIIRTNGNMSNSNHSDDRERDVPLSPTRLNAQPPLSDSKQILHSVEAMNPQTDMVGQLSPGDELIPPVDMIRRKSSIVDIAMALRGGATRKDSLIHLMELAAPQRIQSGKTRYIHPFGRKNTIMDELFPVHEEVASVPEKCSGKESGSLAKYFIWIVFTIFLVGVAGAIILGAESVEWTNSNVTLSDARNYTAQVRTSYTGLRRRYTNVGRQRSY